MASVGEEKSKIIRINTDTYHFLENLKELIDDEKLTYSDLITVGLVFMKVSLEEDPALVKSISNAARMARIKKKRGENIDILNSLVEEYGDEISRNPSNEESLKKLIVEVIELLLDDGYVEAAADLAFAYRSLIGEDDFKEVSTKILERQVQLKNEVMKA